MLKVFTIGMGKRTPEEMLKQLQDRGIQILIDVRSRPYSAYKPEFNREELKLACQLAGLKYAHWPALGGFPEDENVLTMGHVDYSKLAAKPEFRSHLERLVFGVEEGSVIAIMCSEGKPEECHRSKCIGVELAKVEVEVIHIDERDQDRTQEEIEDLIYGLQRELPGMSKPSLSRKVWDKNQQDEL